MTPEDDVNNDKDPNDEQSTDNVDDQESNTNDAVASEAETADEPAVDDAQSADDASDDIDIAANAQGAEGELVDDSDDADDDPLGFGTKRMTDDEAGDELTLMQSQLAEAEARVAERSDQLLRMQAEMENQRKRSQKEVSNAHKFALEKLALDLLPVKDSLEMGLLAATGEDADPEKIVEGSELTLKMLSQALEKYNIVELNPVDEKFDPDFHQAMSMQPVEGKEPNTVASVLQKGYTLNDRLIRPALVMVAK